MLVYLPIAEISANIFYLTGIGAAVGFLSGLFGVGGGFLLTPLLIFSGVPAQVAVASVTGQVVAASTSGALSHYRRGGIDVQLATYLTGFSIIGSVAGVSVFQVLLSSVQLDLVLSLGFLLLLGFVGSTMFVESISSLWKQRRGAMGKQVRLSQRSWLHGLPMRIRFKKSRLYMSVLPIMAIGIFIGFAGSLLGIGGGFIMIPALVYLLKVPGNVVIGTSLMQVTAMMAVTTVLHSLQSQSVDIVLAICLMFGGVVGAQFGASANKLMRGEQLRVLLAILILTVATRFGLQLILPPGDAFSIALPQL